MPMKKTNAMLKSTNPKRLLLATEVCFSGGVKPQTPVIGG